MDDTNPVADATESPDLTDAQISSVEQIAGVVGVEPEQLAIALSASAVDSPEYVLQDCLRTLTELIPIAVTEYRSAPKFSNSQALTGLITSARELIQEIYDMKDNEELFQKLLVEVLQPFCRNMIKDLIEGVGGLMQADLGEVGSNKRRDELSSFSRNIGARFNESYREYNEKLASLLGVSPEARARIMGSADKTS